jgi:cytidine deaminase
VSRACDSAAQALYDEALALARERAWAPYSGYRVGAVVVDGEGCRGVGVNVENAASPAGLCAERAALAAYVAAGGRAPTLVAVAAADGGDCLPCGVCRQALAEFGEPEVVAVADGRLAVFALAELLPRPFRLPRPGERPAARREGDGVEGGDGA